MANLSKGEALPWAASENGTPSKAKSEAERTNDCDLRPVSTDQLGINIGARIEVMWQVEPEEGEPYKRWWGANIMAAGQQEPASTSGSSAQHVYDLKYDAFDDFAEEVVRVQLLSNHQLLDMSQDEIMFWRHEGDRFEPPDHQTMEAEEADALPDTVSLQQLASSIDEAEVAAGEANMLSELAGVMGPAGQIRMAAGYRDFMENFKAFLAAKAASAADGSLVITTDDVEDFRTMMATQRASKMG